ncbi:CHD1 [Lepeophtheirus salmonis]|uniref:CHD1 n=1 Tax=Lepeophtheirus salmonis TaxID=72036 RepID=A0A7R8CS11_LEPSM|nr:CHD1 [Lepeophtheirus salmonis]CAF2910235.1 CHD1 [Lepeophtheirus salmonis]
MKKHENGTRSSEDNEHSDSESSSSSSSDSDLYGIRRSSRSRKEPERLNDDSEEESDDNSSHEYSKPLKKNENSVWNENSSYTESDDNSSSAKKNLKKSVVGRRRKGMSSESEEHHDEEDYRRFSRRRKPDSEKPVSYVIPDSDEDIDGDDDQVASWTYEEDTTTNAEGVNENIPTIEKVIDHRKGFVGGTGAEESEMQYLINWKELSHLHNTWESETSLDELGAKGMKKLHNYMSRMSDYESWKKNANPEDIEYNECQLEMSQQLVSSYTIPERIIAERSVDDQVEYYVKWKNLPYIDATWEAGHLIDNEFQSVIENFRFRQESRYAPSSKSKFFKYRPKFTTTKSQPDYMGGSDDSLKLRDYQLDGINWLVHAWCKQNSVILADEMGLGKTIQTWLWAPDINVLSYVGDVASRSIIREYEWTHPGNKHKQFLINVPYAVIMVDEAHRLKNDDSMLYKCLQDLTVYQRLLITGTPLQNSLKELWSLLHFIMPDKFDRWDEFNEQFGTSSAEKRGYTKLHKLLEPYILRRVKKDVEKSLPAKVERILRVDMSRKQKQFYKWILTRNYAALTKGIKGSTVSFVNIVMELKKCCNHILLTRPEEIDNTFTMSREEKLQFLLRGSGKLLLLDKLLVRLRETGHRVLIFSLKWLDGGIKGELRKQALEHFNNPGSTDFCFLLSTRAGGLGINLATADTVIIFDSDWNPQNDLQAQARAHRIGQKRSDHLVIQRMDTTGTTILNKPKSAEKNSTPFSKEELGAILKFGAEDLFKDEDDGEEEPKCDIDEILNRAETREEETSMSTGEEILSAFKVASFAVDEDEPITIEKSSESTKPDKEWSDIIPQDTRDQIEKTVGEDNASKRKRSSDEECDSDDSDSLSLIKSSLSHKKEAVQEVVLEGETTASKSKAISVKIGNVAVNAKTLCDAVNLLSPLADFLPALSCENDRSSWSKIKNLPFKYKDPGYDDIEWGMSDDVNLLKGVYIHGYGSWDSIKMDRDLELRDKIMSNADRKPQAKHLDSRVAFLLRSLKKSLEGGAEKSSVVPKKSRTSRPKKTPAVLAQNENSNDSKSESHSHTEANEPIIIGELAPEVFSKCKEMMRAVKKSLKSLDRPDQSLGESEKAHHNRHCLLHIGRHIDSLLVKMNSEEKSRSWKSHLKHREKSEDPVKRTSVVDNDRKPSSSSYRPSYHHNKTPNASFAPSFRRDDTAKKPYHNNHNSAEQFNKYPRKSNYDSGGHHRSNNHHLSGHNRDGDATYALYCCQYKAMAITHTGMNERLSDIWCAGKSKRARKEERDVAARAESELGCVDEAADELDPGGVVWVKCGTHYWPGEVKAFDDLPQHVKKDFDPEDEKPKLIVKFFDEDGYEFLEDTKGVFPYNCSKKEEFIKKGLVKSRRTSKEGSSWFAKFPNDIVRCEILTKGDPNILEKEPYIEKNEKVNYKEIFKSSTESVPLSKRRKRSSSSLASPSSKKPKNSDAVNSPKRGRRSETTPTPPRPISHPRFKPGAAGASDHKIKILPQPSSPYHLDLAMKQEKAAQSPSNNYTCSICGFSASRLNVIILHNKSHANQSASSGRQSGSPMMQRSKNGLETSSRHTQEPKKLSKKMTKKLKEIKAKEEEEMKVERRNKILNDWSDDEDNEGGNKIDDPAVEENWDDEEMEIYMGDDNLHQNCSEDENEAIECDNKDTINSKSTKTPGGSMSPKNNDLPDDTTEQHNPSQNTNKSSKTKEHESVNKLCVEGDEVQDKTDTTMGSKGAQEEHQMSQSKLESDGAEIINEPSTKMLKDSELDEGGHSKYLENTIKSICLSSSSTEETVKDSQVTPSETDFSELNSKNVQTPHSQLNDEEEISNSVSSELDKKLDYEPVQDEETFKYSAGNSKSCEYEDLLKNQENHKDVTTSESFEEKKVLKNGSYDETESPSSSNSNIDAPDVIDINKVLEETRVPSLPKDLKDISEVEDSRKKSLCVKVMQPTSNLTDPWDVQDEFMKDQEGASKKRKEADEDAVSTTTPSEKNEKKSTGLLLS